MKNFRNSTTLLKSILLTGCLLLITFRSNAQFSKDQPTRILFLFDASQSMIAKWESNTKFEVARRLLGNMVDSLQRLDNLELALRVYGHTKHYPPQDCDDTRLEVPFGKKNGEQIKKRMDAISPNGTTPIAMSLEKCGGDFPSTPSRNIIVLITDGIEECGGDPCAVSAILQRRGVILKPFVIGLGGNKDFLKQFECVGNYFDASNEEQFESALNIIISQALNNTTVQVNLIDAFGKATETNVPMTFYDKYSGDVRYNIMHTMNVKGNPDTINIDPLGSYNIVVHTVPPVIKDSIILVPGIHNIIGIDAPQGDLILKIDGKNDYRELKAIVRKSGDMNTVHAQEFNTLQRYIVGEYDLEILSTPRIYASHVHIDQSKTTTIQIPSPGIVNFQYNNPGYGYIVQEVNNKLNLVHTLSNQATRESVVLQPGNYRVVYRPKNSQSSQYTIEKSFKITSGTSVSVVIN